MMMMMMIFVCKNVCLMSALMIRHLRESSAIKNKKITELLLVARNVATTGAEANSRCKFFEYKLNSI
jgi:hypothetical protein